MTHEQIKECFRNGDSDWEILAALVNDGWEYPDAEERMRVALRLDNEQVAQMRDAYDNNI